MDLIDQLKALSVRIEDQAAYIITEEATKNACVLPFIQALGYNIFDPKEVVPEYTADFGVKKGEKVDYAILSEGKPILLIECKSYGTSLDTVHASQLYRYFSVVQDARVGILTNGRIYRVYADLDKPNTMDDKPFLEFDILDVTEPQVKEIKKLSKSTFDIDELISTAGELKYIREIIRLLNELYAKPTEEFIKFFIYHVYPGRATQAVIERFQGVLQQALRLFISEKIKERLDTAFSDEEREADKEESTEGQKEERGSGIVTTEEEIEGYHIVKAILRDILDVDRVISKDTKSYFTILFDGHLFKPICKLRFNNPKNKQITLYWFEEGDRKSETVLVEGLYDIFKHAGRIRNAVNYYLNEFEG